MVTLGFGFKSYVGYRMRQRRQKVENIHEDKQLEIMMWTVEHIRIWFAGDTERERDVLLSSTRGSPAGAGQVYKTI